MSNDINITLITKQNIFTENINMSEVERGKFYGKKKFNHRNDRNEQKFGRNNRTLFKADKESKDDEKAKVKQPQFLIKAREKVDDNAFSPKHVTKEKEDVPSVKETPSTSETHLHHNAKRMYKAVKLLDDGILYNDNLHDFLNDTSEFLVVGIIGSQGTGKSTIMNILAADNRHYNSAAGPKPAKNHEDGEMNKHTVFKQETTADQENCMHVTNGIDMFITENRVILLDCQPFLSPSVMDELFHNEKRSNLLSDFSTVDNLGEVQGLQHIAFLMCVCHVLIFVQDAFLDTNSIRYLLTAEMLKPTIPNNEDEFLEQFPHLLLLHNKAQVEDFQPSRFRKVQEFYRHIFRTSKMHLESRMGLATSELMSTLTSTTFDPAINLFLLPDMDLCDESTYSGHPPVIELIKTLKRNVFSVSKFPLSRVTLTEKTWLAYCTKVWEHVKKSSFYVEYSKVLP